MIEKNEIEKKAIELQIHTSNIQRDYLFGWFLHYIFEESSLKDTLFLKGGNALRKGYFIQTRFSRDLDFGTPHDIQQHVLEEEIKKACAYISSKTAIQFVEERNSVEEKFNKWNEPRWQVFEVKIYFKDFCNKADHITLRVSLDVTRFDKNYLPIQNVPLLHPYSDQNEVRSIIRCMKLEEVLATKLKCMLQRQHAPDIFDLIYGIYLNEDIEIDKKEVRRVFLKRTIFEHSPSMAKNTLLKLPLEYLKATWVKGIVYAGEKMIAVEDAIENFTNCITEMFSDVPDTSYHDRLYFSPDFRNIILEAGRTFTLLKVVYDGFERMVEPYSLKFLEKKDGEAREYLYVWDRVGSKNNPGVKMFLPEKITLLENTAEKFTPREGQEIELCRAGEYPEDRYLYDKDKKDREEMEKYYGLGIQTPRPRKRVRRVSSRLFSYGPKYVYRCSSCGKKFTRKTQSSTMRKHKSKNGFDCFGFAVYEGMEF